MNERKNAVSKPTKNYHGVISFSNIQQHASNPEQEPHPQPPPVSKAYPCLPPAAGGLREVR